MAVFTAELVLTALTEYRIYKEHKELYENSPPETFEKGSPLLKTVLHWNPSSNIIAASKRLFKNCSVSRCILSKSKSSMTEADAVIFDGTQTQNMPPKDVLGQVWIFATMEPPVYNHKHISRWKNVFNWTFSYRRDSDILAMYGGITPKEENIENDYFNTLLHKKSKDIMWMASNCQTKSKREKYVAKLQRLRKIDVFGACGRLQCPRSGNHSKCNRILKNETYKFYLAFENSLCRDYATEKIFQTMKYDIVPIIRGGYDKTLYLPNDSFIDANIKDPSELYSLLLQNRNDSQYYAQFFQWRKHFISKNSIPYGWCEICARLHDLSSHRRLYNDIDQWWRGGPDSPKICAHQNR